MLVRTLMGGVRKENGKRRRRSVAEDGQVFHILMANTEFTSPLRSVDIHLK